MGEKNRDMSSWHLRDRGVKVRRGADIGYDENPFVQQQYSSEVVLDPLLATVNDDDDSDEEGAESGKGGVHGHGHAAARRGGSFGTDTELPMGD